MMISFDNLMTKANLTKALLHIVKECRVKSLGHDPYDDFFNALIASFMELRLDSLRPELEEAIINKLKEIQHLESEY